MATFEQSLAARNIGASGRAASRLLMSAQRPLGDLSAVMATPPTISLGTAGANSTIVTTANQNIGGGTYNSENPQHVTLMWGSTLTSTGTIAGTSYDAGGAKRQGHSNGVAFNTLATDVDICLRAGPTRPWIAYVTENGVRRRVVADDQVPTDGFYYVKFTFATRAPRMIEVYGGYQGAFRGLNVADGESITPAVLPEPKIGFVWDSWGVGQNGDAAATVSLKTAVADWFCGMFGVRSPIVSALTGTGVIADSGQGAAPFPLRVSLGDMDVAKVGRLDLFCLPGSVNDGNGSTGGLASPEGDAAVQTAYQAHITAAAAKQPDAIIMGWPAQTSSGQGPVASRSAAYRAGFMAAKAAAAEPKRFLWLDDSPFAARLDTGITGPSSGHPSIGIGQRVIGERLAASAIRALQGLLNG